MAEIIEEEIDATALFETSNDVYIPYYWNTSRYLIVYGGAGSGKSRWVGQKILFRILDEVPHRILIVRKVQNTLRRSVFQLMLDYISKYGLSSKFKISTSSMTIECENGNKMYFLGLDDVEKLKSIEGITSIWIEESSEVTQDDFTQLDLRLRGVTENYQQIILTFNPISETHWIKKRFFDVMDNDATIVKTTYLDNKFIDERYKQVLRDLKNTDERMYNIYALGEWGVLKGTALKPYLDIQAFPTLEQVPDLDVSWGADFGTAHPSAITRVGYSKANNALYFDEVLYQSGLTRIDLIRKTKEISPDLMQIIGFGDSAEPATITEFNRYGFIMKPAIKDTNLSIDFINRHTVYITKRSVNLKREWNEYKWKLDANGEPTDQILKANDDAVDSARYGSYSKWGVIIDSKGVVSDKMLSSVKDFGRFTGGQFGTGSFGGY